MGLPHLGVVGLFVEQGRSRECLERENIPVNEYSLYTSKAAKEKEKEKKLGFEISVVCGFFFCIWSITMKFQPPFLILLRYSFNSLRPNFPSIVLNAGGCSKVPTFDVSSVYLDLGQKT